METGFSRLQAIMRGNRSRELHVRRLRQGAAIVCPFVSANASVVDKVITCANISKSDLVMDIGSGDGGILLNICKAVGARCIGIEIDEILCRTARRKVKEAKLEALIDVVIDDAIHANVSFSSVITLFLVPSCLSVLSPILKEKCASGTRIVNIKFPLPPPWNAVKVLECDDVVKPGSFTFLYLYIV